MADLKNTLVNLNKNLAILQEREAKYGGNAPLELLHQIRDHKQAIDITHQAITGKISREEWREAVKPLLLAFNNGQVINIDAETYVGHVQAQRDVKFVGTEVVSERPLSSVEEERQAARFARRDLARGIKSYIQHITDASALAADQGGPYRGLLNYDMPHARLFFGRDKAIRNLLETIKHHNLTVLHAASGAGKSSLLKAGVAPRLIDAGHLVINIRPNQDPVLAIKRVLLPTVDQTPLLLNATLGGFLWQVRQSEALDTNSGIYIFLDQFEEFFTELAPKSRENFRDQLVECLENIHLNVHWVLSLRKEYVSDLSGLKPHIQNPLGNEYRLDFLTRNQARAVIVRPAAEWGVTVEEALVDALLDDLSRNRFYPPHIQLVCHTLYQERAAETNVITLDLYRSLGKTAGILRNYLNRIINSLSRKERPLARRLLEFLITSDDRRVARTQPELTNEFATSKQQAKILDLLLRQLINSHMVQQVEVLQEEQVITAYELAHDYLIERLNLDPEVRARKAVKEMLAQEVQDYRRYGTLLSRDKLEFIQSRLTPDEIQAGAKALILGSALALDYNIDFWWAETRPDTRKKVLSEALQGKTAGTRLRAAARVPECSASPLAKPLVTLMQNDPDLAVRQAAGLSLAQVDRERFNDTLRKMRGNAPAYPTKAMEVMAFVQDKAPALLDLSQLPGNHRLVNWRMRGLRVSRNWSQVGFTTLYAALGAGLGAALGGLIGAWGLSNHTILVLFAFVYGLAVGGSVGLGYGLAAVMDKHLGLTEYAISAALTGSIVMVLYFVSGDASHRWDIPFSLIVGGFSGISGALITRATQLHISAKRQRQWTRLLLSLLCGMVLGIALAWADYQGIFPTTPDHPGYGLVVGLLLIPGLVVVGLGGWNKS